MDPFELRSIGRTDVKVTPLGFGGATLGDLWESIPEAQAERTIDSAYTAGINFFDTAPWYGLTKSEHRFGHVLRTKPRDSFVLSTKIGRVFSRPRNLAQVDRHMWTGGLPFELRFDYSRDAVLRSYEDSLQRLGLNAVDTLAIHDLDLKYQLTADGVTQRFHELEQGGGFTALVDLKRTGHIRAIGAGINHVGMIPQFLERFDLDFFIVAMPYTLLCQDALDTELPLCVERGVGVVIGAPFASGILATGPRPKAHYGYNQAEVEVVERTRRIEEVCRHHGVPLGAAAIQFPLAHPAVAAVIPGPNTPEQVHTNLEWMRCNVPTRVWSELKSEGLLRPDAPTPAEPEVQPLIGP